MDKAILKVEFLNIQYNQVLIYHEIKKSRSLARIPFKLQNLIENIMTCSHQDQPVLCFSDKCPEIASDFNLIFGSSVDCRNSVYFIRFLAAQ